MVLVNLREKLCESYLLQLRVEKDVVGNANA